MKLSIILPVYNEANTVYEILKTLFYYSYRVKHIQKVIVVNDGSTDGSKEIMDSIKKLDYADKFRIIHLEKNRGKGNAVREAFKYASGDYVMLLDADLIRLKESHLDSLRKCAINNDMVIGLRDKNKIQNKVMPYFPLTGGERMIRTELLRDILGLRLSDGWGLEAVMNDYCKKRKMKVATILLKGLDHIGLQTKKYGWMAFLKECYDVILVKIKLIGVDYSDIPHN